MIKYIKKHSQEHTITYNNIFLIHIIITITLDPLNPGVVIYYPPALEGFSRLS